MKTAFDLTKELIQKTHPSMAYTGGDLAAWQGEARKKLAELLGMDKFRKVDPAVEIEYEKDIPGGKDIRFTFQSEEGYRVPCHIALPDGVENPPVMICLQGHSTGMHVSMGQPKYPGDEEDIRGDRDFCIRAMKEGFAGIALEQRNFGECGGDEKGPHCAESTLTALLMGRTTIGERVWDVSRVIDVLEETFSHRLDMKTVGVMGNSGGGTTMAYVAALEERICLAMPSCAMCTYKDSIGAMSHCSCNYVPHIAEYFDMGDLMAMACPSYFVQVSGRDDGIFPLPSAKDVFEIGKAAYGTQGMDGRCAMVVGNGGHRFYADDAWPIVHKFLNR